MTRYRVDMNAPDTANRFRVGGFFFVAAIFLGEGIYTGRDWRSLLFVSAIGLAILAWVVWRTRANQKSFNEHHHLEIDETELRQVLTFQGGLFRDVKFVNYDGIEKVVIHQKKGRTQKIEMALLGANLDTLPPYKDLDQLVRDLQVKIPAKCVLRE